MIRTENTFWDFAYMKMECFAFNSLMYKGNFLHWTFCSKKPHTFLIHLFSLPPCSCNSCYKILHHWSWKFLIKSTCLKAIIEEIPFLSMFMNHSSNDLLYVCTPSNIKHMWIYLNLKARTKNENAVPTFTL